MVSLSSKYHINLNDLPNPNCKYCKPEERKELEEDTLCSHLVSVDDKLPIRCVGSWGYQKIYRLVQYFNIFTKGMKNKWAGKLNYIEICSGPGRNIFRENGEEVDGTSLSIIKNPNITMLNKVIFIDNEDKIIEALNQRIRNHQKESQASAIKGNYNDLSSIKGILNHIPANSLNLVFIDPTECNIPFDLIRLINETLKNVDFIINVALGTDANRNLINAFCNDAFSKVRNKYESFLGQHEFFSDPSNIQIAKIGNNSVLKEKFLKTYEDSFHQIGYKYIDMKPVLHFYFLMFASKHPIGLKFWREANTFDPNGQKTFNF